MHASDEDKIKAVTAKLAGEFYVGQPVMIDDEGYVGMHWNGREGIVRRVTRDGIFSIGVDLGEFSDGEIIYFEPRSVKPR